MKPLAFAVVLSQGAPLASGTPPKPAEPPAAHAPAPSQTPAKPSPPPELGEAFKFLEGAWKCDTRFAADAFGPGSPEMTAKATLKVKRDLDGFFYRGEYELPKTRTMPGFRALLYLGHQPSMRLYTLTVLDGSGSALLATSAGFDGDAIVFTGDAYTMGRRLKLRETLARVGKSQLTRRTELDLGKGPQLIAEDACRR